MLGLTDIGIILAYTLCIAVAVLCVVYGIVNWNKGGDSDEKEIRKEIKWKQDEQEINEKL